VEATLALHYVFDSPKDKIVFDVSHQCYAHKMITGRQEGFTNPEMYARISGYTNPDESEHDFFKVGHTSTSVSLASGLAKARDLKGEKHNVIAIIGDGSLSGGEALEGLDFAGAELQSNFIVVVNDNDMSIAENHGGIYANLKLLRESQGKAECNIFKALGYDYLYVDGGNDVAQLIAAFQRVKDCAKPVVVHLNTLKGKGYKLAETNKEPWHWSMPFDVKSGQLKGTFPTEPSYNDLTYNFLKQKIDNGENVAVVVAGTPGVFALTKEKREALGSHYIDVGIAEEHAVAMCSALAKGGARPVFQVMSSFLQRTYDQLSQDLAINSNPAVILVHAGTISSADVTHLGCFDIAMAGNIPNIVFLTPSNQEDYLAMLRWAMTQTAHPVIIRVPVGPVVTGGRTVAADTSLLKYRLLRESPSATQVFLASGPVMVQKALARAEKEDAAVVDVRCVSALDTEMLDQLAEKYQQVVTFEDGIVNGGWGEKIASYYGESAIRVKNLGARKEFTDREEVSSIYERCGF
jgi:1-deoxy-D-xylulose-5-phosphate synthase